MKVLILGCGPAGLMAAQGVFDAWNANGRGDLEISILSRKVKSALYGAQYLHQPIPGVSPQSARHISYRLRGSSDDYRRKVYGQLWSGSVSPEDLDGDHLGWDIRATYDNLWDRWGYAITDSDVDPVLLSNILSDDVALVINSIPRPVLCHAGHAFGSTEVWAAGDAPALGIRLPFSAMDETVICNGDENPAWYRLCRVFGHTTVEWPGSLMRVPVDTAARVQKPTKHDCDCWPTIKHVGRYGTWEKGVLSHTAYFQSFKMADQLIGVSGEAEEAERS